MPIQLEARINMPIHIQGPQVGQSVLCEPILRALPDWFGIEEAIVHYVEEINRLPTFFACQGKDVLGFLSLKQHNAFAAEVYVMGIKVEVQRQGIGSKLIQAAETYLRSQGTEYLQVKTLSDSHPDEHYARTRIFYLAVGFRPLEELPTLWSEDNPCLIMVKRL